MIIAARIIDFLYTAITILLFARVIFSWIRVSPYHPTWGSLVRLVYEATEPLLAPIRNLLPPMGGFDFSVLILFILARILRDILIGLVI